MRLVRNQQIRGRRELNRIKTGESSTELRQARTLSKFEASEKSADQRQVRTEQI